MYSDSDIEAMIRPLIDIQYDMNNFVLTKIAKRVQEIGKMSASDLFRIEQLYRSSQDVEEIKSELARLTKKSTVEIERLIRKCAEESYADARPFYEYKNKYIPFAQNAEIQAEIETVARRTMETYNNIANTTAFFLRDPLNRDVLIPTSPSDTYTKVIDEAIIFSRRGVVDYQSAVRTAMREVIDSGLCQRKQGTPKVRYASGNLRRLDTAVRMNVLEGIKQINQGVQDITGQQFGADGKEISVHFAPAPDHEQCQGHIFTLDAYDRLNHGEDVEDVNGVKITGFTREIGTLNCKHFAFSVIIGISEPIYSSEELKKFISKNHKGIEYRGKHYTIYQAEQRQRQLETKIRRAKDGINAARASGDKTLVGHYTEKYYKCRKEYTRFSKAAGLSEKTERISVSGFKRPPSEASISIIKENSRKRLTRASGDVIIEIGPRPIKRSIEFAVGKGMLESRPFRDKFNTMSVDPVRQRDFYQKSKAMLEHRSGTNGEDLYLYNATQNKWYASTKSAYASRAIYTEEQEQMLSQSKDEKVIAFHNHPLGMPPSISDLNSAFLRGYRKAYTIGHNGRIYEYTAPMGKIDVNENVLLKKYEDEGLSEHDAQLKLLEELKEIYKFTVKEL